MKRKINGTTPMPKCNDFYTLLGTVLPCPFCGTEAFVNRKDASYIIMCTKCVTVQMVGIELETAIERWNKRHYA
jgi:Lar family restriction alleviation protein